MASGPAAGVPRVAVNRGGDAVLVWVRGGADPAVLASVRPSGSVDWPAPERLSAPCPVPAGRGCAFADARVAIDDDGDVAAAWVGLGAPGSIPGGAVQAAVRIAGSGGWTRPQPLSEVLGARPAVDVGIDTRGAVTAVWTDGDQAVRAAPRPAGGNWSAAVRLSGPEEAGPPRLAVGPRGDALAVWAGDDCRPWAARREAGGDWEAPVALEPEGACGDGPAAGVDGSGNAVAAWRHWTGTARTLRTADLAAGADGWQMATDLGPAAAGALDPPPLEVAPGRRAVLVWRDATGAVRFATRPAGGAWGPAQPVPGASAPGTAPSLGFALAPDGAALIVLGGGGGRPPRAIGRPAGAGWGPMAPIGPPPESGLVVPVAAVDGSGDAVAAWSEGGAIAVGELTARPGRRLASRAPRVVRLEAPAASPAGALARLRAILDGPASDLPVTVEHRVGGAWVRLGTVEVTASASAELPVRLLQPGVVTLRARTVRPGGGTRVTGAVSLRVTRPGRRRLAVGSQPAAVAVGEGAVWVLGSDAGQGTVRRLDPATGRPLGRLIVVGGTPTALAAGAGAVWVVRNGGELIRIDARSGAVSPPRRLAGSSLTVSAGAGGVWVGGVCLPEPTPADACSRQAAVRVRASTGEPDGWRALLPRGRVRGVRAAGRTLWLWGPRERGGTVLGRADAATGRLRRAVTLPGRPGVAPIGPDAVWSLAGGRIAVAWPRPGAALHDATGRSPALALAPGGGGVWALERVVVRRGVRSGRLLRLSARTGRPLAPPLDLGEAAAQDELLVAGSAAAWVLRPLEGALIRVAAGRRA